MSEKYIQGKILNGTYEDNKDSIIKKELSTKGIFGMDIKENLMNYIRNIESERIVEENFRYLKEHPAIRYCVSLMADISKEIDYVRSISDYTSFISQNNNPNEFDKQQVQNVIFSDLFYELFSEVMKSVTMRNYYYDSQYSLSLEKKNIKEIIVEDKDQLEEKK